MSEPGVFERLTHALAGWRDCEQRIAELEAQVASLQMVIALGEFARRPSPRQVLPPQTSPRVALLRPRLKQGGHL